MGVKISKGVCVEATRPRSPINYLADMSPILYHIGRRYVLLGCCSRCLVYLLEMSGFSLGKYLSHKVFLDKIIRNYSGTPLGPPEAAFHRKGIERGHPAPRQGDERPPAPPPD